MSEPLTTGEMAARIAAFDWASTSLGPRSAWSPALRVSVDVMLASRFPMILWLGDELVVLYNDAYIPILGAKHPGALGATGLSRAAWGDPEVREVIGPMLHGVLRDGRATWSEDQLLVLERRGFPEETYFTWSYSPISEGGAIVGVFTAVFETTSSVIGARRLGLLSELTAGTSEAPSAEEACRRASQVLAGHRLDVPFHRIYLSRPDTTAFVASDGEVREAAASDAGERLAELVAAGVHSVAPGELGWRVESPAWGEAVTRLALLRLVASGEQRTTGILVAGLSPRLAWDDAYLAFLELLGSRIGTAVNDARALEEERRRAEALAELDRSKSVFFGNVSHEFRTPLTLILGPLEEMLRDGPGVTWDVQRERLEIARDNGLRMLKLVNSLLEFSRVEAGRARVNLLPVDLAAVTSDLVGVFRSAFIAAGLELELRIGDLGGAIEVDLDAWESIVLNLLSNALKYTPAGRVDVALRAEGPEIELTVSDTGVGIDPAEIDRIFERFYRAPNEAGRSMEGTGIGLALARELARLQGGDVTVASRPGEGSTFAVRLPARRAASAVRSEGAAESARARSFLEEAFRWLPEDGSVAPRRSMPIPAGSRPRLLVVDDNADMRRYLVRILGSSYDVAVASNGEEALAAAREARPAAVVSDVMMPVLDGLGLVAAMRADEQLRDVPVLLLSARAGREATVEGLESGADDYLVKPFSARELSARVTAAIASAGRRDELDPLEQERRRLEALPGEAARALSTATDLSQIARAVQGAFSHHDHFLGSTLSVRERDGATVRQYFGRTGVPAEILARYLRTPLELDTFHTRAIRTGESSFFPDFDALVASFPRHVEEGRLLGLQSAALLPLTAADGDVLGGLALGWSAPLEFDDRLIGSLEDVGQSVSRAVERVHGYELQRELARAFQLALLSVDTRATSGVVRTRYRAADEAVEIGGDWYDAVELPDGRLAVGVGDVVGRGLPAATAMGQLRAGLAAVVLQSGDPTEALQSLDRFARGVPGAGCTTVALAVVDTVASTVTYHCAGHPYPVLVSPDGDVSLLDGGRSWPLQSAEEGPRPPSAVAPFPPGATLLLYTDGLVERRGESLTDGFERLLEVVRRRWSRPLSLLEADLIAELVEGLAATDDLAVVGLRRCGSAPGLFTDAMRATPGELRQVRRRFSAWLAQHDLDQETLDAALLATGEACANAVEHGSRGDAGAVVSVEASLRDGELLVAVSDSGAWLAGVDGFRSGRGRGHRIMDALASEVAVASDRQGSVVTLRFVVARRAAV